MVSHGSPSLASQSSFLNDGSLTDSESVQPAENSNPSSFYHLLPHTQTSLSSETRGTSSVPSSSKTSLRRTSSAVLPTSLQSQAQPIVLPPPPSTAGSSLHHPSLSALPWPYLLLQQQAAALPLPRPPKKTRSSGSMSSGSRIIPTIYVNELHEAWNARPGSIPSKGSIAAWAHARNVNQGRVIGWFRWKRTHAQKLGQPVAGETDEGYDLTEVTPAPPSNPADLPPLPDGIAFPSLEDLGPLDAMDLDPELFMETQPGPSRLVRRATMPAVLPNSLPFQFERDFSFDPATHGMGMFMPDPTHMPGPVLVPADPSSLLSIIKQHSAVQAARGSSRTRRPSHLEGVLLNGNGRRNVYSVLKENGIVERTHIGFVTRGGTVSLSAVEALSRWILDIQTKPIKTEVLRELFQLRPCGPEDVDRPPPEEPSGSTKTPPLAGSTGTPNGKRKSEEANDDRYMIDTFRIPMDIRPMAEVIAEIVEEIRPPQARKRRRMEPAPEVKATGGRRSPRHSTIEPADTHRQPLSAQTSLASAAGSSSQLLVPQTPQVPSSPPKQTTETAPHGSRRQSVKATSSSRSISALLNPAPDSPQAEPQVKQEPRQMSPSVPPAVPANGNVSYISTSPSMTRRGAGLTKSGKPRRVRGSGAAAAAAAAAASTAASPPVATTLGGPADASGSQPPIPPNAIPLAIGPPSPLIPVSMSHPSLTLPNPYSVPPRDGQVHPYSFPPSSLFTTTNFVSPLPKKSVPLATHKNELDMIWRDRPGQTPSVASLSAWADARNVDVTKVKRWFGLKKNWVLRGGGKLIDGDYELSEEVLRPKRQLIPLAHGAMWNSNATAGPSRGAGEGVVAQAANGIAPVRRGGGNKEKEPRVEDTGGDTEEEVDELEGDDDPHEGSFFGYSGLSSIMGQGSGTFSTTETLRGAGSNASLQSVSMGSQSQNRFAIPSSKSTSIASLGDPLPPPSSNGIPTE